MKKNLVAIVLLLLVMTFALPLTAHAYSANTSYAGWYEVCRVSQCLSINSQPKASGSSGVKTIWTKQTNGCKVHIADAESSAGTAKKWGRVDKVYYNGKISTIKDLTGYTGNAYACMYYLKKTTAPTLGARLVGYDFGVTCNDGRLSIKNGYCYAMTVNSSTRLVPILTEIYSNGSTRDIAIRNGAGITFKSSKPAVASVSSVGTVFAKKTGTTVITVKSKMNNMTRQFTLRVTAPSVPSICTLSTGGNRITLRFAKAAPSGASYQVRWDYSNQPFWRYSMTSTSSSMTLTKGLVRGRSFTIQVRFKYWNGSSYSYTSWSNRYRITVR